MQPIVDNLPLEERIAPSLLNVLDKVGVIILAGGEGKRLEPLTKTRCKPVLTFGGHYSLIDVPISYALSSGLKQIYVLGQYLVNSLQQHLFETYHHNGFSQAQVHMLNPEERDGKKIWYKGTADAIRQNLHYFSQLSCDYYLVLSGDQLYNINFQDMINFALEKNASMVIAAQPVSEKEAKRMGVLKIQPSGTQLIDFIEKPQEKEVLSNYYTDDLTLHKMGYDARNEKRYLGSMGIYLFKRQTLFDLLQSDDREDFGKHLIKVQMQKNDTHVFLYDGYWEDIGTVEAYYRANLLLTQTNLDRKSGFQFYDKKTTIFSKTTFLPNARITNTHVEHAIICEGCIIEAKEIRHSIIGQRSVIKKGTIIHNSILLGNEYYIKYPMKPDEKENKPSIGEDCVITKAIIDENVTIGNAVQLINKWGHINYNSPEGVVIRDGIIVVPRGIILPDHFIL